jgi:hypothetical protein
MLKHLGAVESEQQTTYSTVTQAHGSSGSYTIISLVLVVPISIANPVLGTIRIHVISLLPVVIQSV